MRFRFIMKTKEWQTSYTQSGCIDGWSAWENISRLEALNYIEQGWEFSYI